MRSKYFKLYELVPKNMYDNLHEELLWGMLDENLIEMADKIKETFPEGTMTINNYFWGGNREWSGIRSKASKWYSPTSQHSLGKAIDCVFSDYLVADVRQYIIDNPTEFPYIKGIELDVSWLHFDTRDSDQVRLFKA
jgi:hypothetical protein